MHASYYCPPPDGSTVLTSSVASFSRDPLAVNIKLCNKHRNFGAAWVGGLEFVWHQTHNELGF